MKPETPSPADAWRLIERYLADDCTAEEAHRARILLDSDAGGRFVHIVGERLAHGRPTTDAIDKALARLQAARRDDDRRDAATSADHASRAAGSSPSRSHEDRRGTRSGIRNGTRTRVPWRSIRGLAWGVASVALVVGVAFVGWHDWRARNHGASTARIARTVATGIGQRTTLHLADGTQVILAPCSRLTIPTDFGGDTRTLSLTGEAYFDVAHVHSAPFVVRAGAVETRVLGTTFAVRHYRPSDDVRVVVTSGKVMAGAEHGQTVTVTAGAIAHVTDSTALLATASDPASYVAWTDGRLAFRNAPVPELLETLGRWYGFDFRLADSALAQLHVTTTLDNRPPQTVLRALTLLLDVRLTFDGTENGATIVTLHANPKTAATPMHQPMRARPVDLTPHTELGR